MLNSVTNYELHKGLYSGHNDHNYFEIAHTIRREFDENGGIYKGLRLYSFVDNHDVDRIASKLNVPEHISPYIRFYLHFRESLPFTMDLNGVYRDVKKAEMTILFVRQLILRKHFCIRIIRSFLSG